MFLALTQEHIALILLGVCVIPIALLIVYGIVKMILKAKKSLKKSSVLEEEKDQEQLALFESAYGGRANMVSVSNEINRVTVEVNDIQLVDAQKLKELGATGVLLVGNQVKCGFGDRAIYVYNLLK